MPPADLLNPKVWLYASGGLIKSKGFGFMPPADLCFKTTSSCRFKTTFFDIVNGFLIGEFTQFSLQLFL